MVSNRVQRILSLTNSKTLSLKLLICNPYVYDHIGNDKR